jgi:hypothetical protein
VSARRALIAALVAVAALAAAPVASAEDITREELVALAGDAERDPGARERLLGIDGVDGEPVPVGELLRGARPAEMAARARALAEALEPAAPAPAGAARERAAAVLADPRYSGADLPRPFEGPLQWLGDQIQPLLDRLDEWSAQVPGGPPVFWLLACGGILLIAAGISAATIRRRAVETTRARAAASGLGEDPRELERDADRAERDGDWERAVRLRFRAGLLRLDARRVIAYRPSLTTGEVARATGSAAFVPVGDRFDAIVYGGEPAAAADAESARTGWAAVLAEAR